MFENPSPFSDLYSCYSAPCHRVKTAASNHIFRSFSSSSLDSQMIQANNSKTEYFLNYLENYHDFPNEKEEEPRFQQVSFIPIDNSSEKSSKITKVNTNICINIGEIQAKFFDCLEEKAKFLLRNFEFSYLETYEFGFNASSNYFSLRNIKERRIFLENILEIEKIHVIRDIFLLSIHYLNENFSKSMATVHAHLIICCEDSAMQACIESFFENHLRKYHKNIIKPKQISQKNEETKQQGAVPSSPPQQFEEISKKLCEEPQMLRKDQISSFNDYFQEKLKEKPEKTQEKLKEKQEKREKTHKIIEREREKLKEIFKKSVKTLMKGYVFNKYGYHGLTFLQPQRRQLIFSSDLRKFVLLKPGKSIKKSTKFFRIEEIIGIKDGRNTKNFSRFKTKSSEKLETSFSLELKTRSIDLQACNLREKSEFCQALQMILQIHRSCSS